MTLPVGAVIETIVLLNVLLMWACPRAKVFRPFRRTFLAASFQLFAGGISLFCPSYEVIGPSGSGLLLPGLLLAGHRLLLALAGARVGLGALPVHRKPATVADP